MIAALLHRIGAWNSKTVTGGGIPSDTGWTWEYQRRVHEAEQYWERQRQLESDAVMATQLKAEELERAIEEQAREREIQALKQDFTVAQAERILAEQALHQAHAEYLTALSALQESEKRRIREEAERVQAEALAAEQVRQEKEIADIMMMLLMEV